MILILLCRARAYRRIRKDEFVNGMNKKTLGNGHNRKINVTFAFELLLAATVRDGWGGFFLLHFCYIFATFLLNLATLQNLPKYGNLLKCPIYKGFQG